MKWLRSGTIFIVFISFSPFAQAGLNPKLGSFEWNKNLNLGQNTKDGFQFSINYSSRQIFRGLFGHGWCSDLDVHLDRTQDDRWFYNRCGETQEIKKPVDLKVIDKNQTVWTFDRNGSLVKVSKAGASIDIVSRTSDALKIKSGREMYDFQLDQFGQFIVAVKKSQKNLLSLSYNGSRLVQINGTVSEKYHYDDWNNLTELREGEDIKYTIAYDLGYDRVTSLTTGRCSIELKYHPNPSTSGERKNTINVTQVCASVPVFTKIYSL